MVSAALCSAAAAGALLDIIPEPIPGMELPAEAGLLDMALEPVEHPARAIAAAMAAAERVRSFVFIMFFESFKTSAGAWARQG
jgi:hypothetical protein